MKANQLLLFNVGVATEEAKAMPLYYKKEGHVIAFFVENTGCQNLPPGSPICRHTDVDVQVVHCCRYSAWPSCNSICQCSRAQIINVDMH
jgi:hypothetical protein